MFEQRENVTIALLVRARQLLAVMSVAFAITGTGSKFMPLPSAHAHGINGRCRILFVHRLHVHVRLYGL